MAIEMSVFDPDEIGLLLVRDLAGGLRAIADAIEGGRMDARLMSSEAYGFTPRWDTRTHVLVKLDLAAEARTFRRVEVAAQLGSGDEQEKVR